MSDELKPCPFCKSGAHTFHGWLWHVACDEADGKEYTRCPFIGCDGWEKLVELRGDA